VSNITLPRADAERIRAALVSGKRLFAALAALDAALAEPEQKPEQYPEKGPALAVYNEIAATDDPGSPLERLRFFCSLAMRPQDWLDVAPFFDALAEQEDEALLNEPVAMRYDGDGYGYLYIDSGSGSDWQRRHKDAEPLYLAPPKSDAKPEPITQDALQKEIEAQDRDLWQRRADEEFLKEYERRYGKREPATVEQVIAAHGPSWGPSATADFFTGFRAAERHHGIRKEDK
jgi:hypothetical protein